jgi:hypothetical protein
MTGIGSSISQNNSQMTPVSRGIAAITTRRLACGT